MLSKYLAFSFGQEGVTIILRQTGCDNYEKDQDRLHHRSCQ